VTEEEYERLQERVRVRAYRIWEREGRPEGREQDHWDLAREEIAIEDNIEQTLEPNPSEGPEDTVLHPRPVEPLLAVESQGEGFGPAGQDDVQPVPARRTRTRRGRAGGEG
jgi:hypothetical protein